jgi:hypothetical protein
LVGKPRERNHLEDIANDGRIIIKWIIKYWDERVYTGFICLRIGISGGLFYTQMV